MSSTQRPNSAMRRWGRDGQHNNDEMLGRDIFNNHDCVPV